MGNGQYAYMSGSCLDSSLLPQATEPHFSVGENNQSMAKRLYKKAADILLITYEH
jgi:hypothetical protein